MLELKSINLWFGANHVLRDLNCEVSKGDFIVILGTNGAGKSSFFDTIAGKIKPQTGEIILNNLNVTKLSQQNRAGMITRIFQNTRLNSAGNLTVAQNLALAHYSRRNAKLVDGMAGMPRKHAEQILNQLNIDLKLLDRPMQQLSGGQRQLIAFAMSTQKIPQILLLDEPTAALDPQAATKLLQHACSFIKKNQVTTLLITHDPQIALSLGNKIWILENGQISRTYTLADKPNLDPDKLIGQIDYAKLT